ncbi:ABC transporter permease subunit [Ilumatobacter nonamiensis]|uniref:ABC transporter permease subunit n=1 Tax=Ilumatobacter nonamiensis TaxID=467093 RepID=UPI000348F994|nr:ABC transporter permease subunit [Ilumatobacter nonamiensis]
MTAEPTSRTPTTYPTGIERSSVRGVDAAIISYRLVLGQMRSPGRIVALFLLSLTATVAGFALGVSDEATVDRAASVVANLGFAVVVPVVCLVFAGGSIGDLREDKTLVYLWLRPMSRWPLVVGAALASLTLAAPIVLATVVTGAALTGVGNGLVGATLLATLVGLVVYTAIFTMLGVWLQRHIVWGLAYILIWEGFVALGGAGTAQFAMRTYTRSIIVDRTGADLGGADFSTIAAVIVPLAVSVVAVVLASWRLSHQDVD